ncbi:MAG: hypothetical protein K0R65_2687 [Crocinitomicaceae bacterium]|jgi:hypothetical protein|nr:hypothetical protein [Crocinitomicaceae bacterium]
MKYWKQITVFTLFSFFAQGQTITYKVIKDTPDDIANYWINVGVVELGYASDNAGFGLLGSSLGGVVHYKNKFGGELFYKHNFFSLDTTKTSRQFEIGGFYHFASKSKTKSQKVILAEKKNGNSEVSIKVPATIQRSFGLRAGLTMLSGGLATTPEAHGTAAEEHLLVKTIGIYAGVLMTSSLNARCHTQEYGIKSAGFVRRNYLDVMINPVNQVTDLSGNAYTGTIKKGVIGFRLGVQFLKAEPKKLAGSAFYHKLEIGSRPIDGYYGTYTMGFNFKRRVKSMSSFTVIREKE